MNNLSFKVYRDGKVIRCDIVACVVDENNEVYIAFTDYINDDAIQCAKLTRKGKQFAIENFDNAYIVEKLKEKVACEILNFFEQGELCS